MNEDNLFGFAYKPDHFCDGKAEMKQLELNFFNGLNTVAHSPRRLGKSAMIQHLFH